MQSHETDTPLPGESLLLEYQPSDGLGERNALYSNREHFRTYWERNRWLKLDFERGEPCVRATHFVGLMPFRCGKVSHMIMVAPKGCCLDTPENPSGLLRFLDLVAVANGGQPIEDSQGFAGKSGRELFVGLLAKHYGRLLHDLCRRDYRRDFQPQEEELHGRLRGRIDATSHLRNSLRGREHRIPCRWQEFTPDNWDNRILLGAVRRLQQSAASIAPEAGRHVKNMFLGLEPWFSSVEDMPIGAEDFGRARLWRVSRYYRTALEWARLIIRGVGRPVTGGEAQALVVNANDAFERFAKIIARGVANTARGREWEVFVANLVFFRDGQANRNPDLAIRSRQEVVAVGDAKYKDVLEQPLSPVQLGELRQTIVPRISPADWYQLYVYIRLASASCGFFVVPFWNETADAAQLITDREFEVPPLDRADGRTVRLAVLGLNLVHPLHRVRDRGVALLGGWLRGSPTLS